MGHGRQNITMGRVRLVLALGIRIKEDKAVGIIDRLDPYPLTLILRVLGVLIFSQNFPLNTQEIHGFFIKNFVK